VHGTDRHALAQTIGAVPRTQAAVAVWTVKAPWKCIPCQQNVARLRGTRSRNCTRRKAPDHMTQLMAGCSDQPDYMRHTLYSHLCPRASLASRCSTSKRGIHPVVRSRQHSNLPSFPPGNSFIIVDFSARAHEQCMLAAVYLAFCLGAAAH
jgi:hypothetical protein